jgi:autotransporter-associated beta strand protein
VPTWTANSGDWDTAGNWSGGIPNASGASAIFSFSDAISRTVTIKDTDIYRVGVMPVILNGTGDLLIRGSSADGGTGQGRLIFDNGANDAILSFSSNSNSNILTISDTNGLRVTLTSDTVFNIANAGTAVIMDAPISGPGQMIVRGAGILLLNRANTISGGISIEGGNVNAVNDAALGSGDITLSDAGEFFSEGVVNNSFVLLAGEFGTIGARSGTTLTLNGVLDHQSTNTLRFDANSGTIILAFSSLSTNAVGSDYRLEDGTFRMGNASNAANLFNRPGAGAGASTELAGTLDTGGFVTTITNLNFINGTLQSTGGALDVTVNNGDYPGFPQNGTIIGTAFADRLVFNVSDYYELNASSFTVSNWSAGDTITFNGSSLANTIVGTSVSETINGFDGGDLLNGVSGADTINGGNGDDGIVIGGNGCFVDGGSGTDLLRITNDVLVFGLVSGFEGLQVSTGKTVTFTGAQFAGGFSLFSTLNGDGSVIVDLSAGNQVFNARGMVVQQFSDITFTVNGTNSADTMKTATGAASVLFGYGGTDILVGSDLIDSINGGTEIDKIRGGGGADALIGGAGADIFKYRAASDSGIGAAADIISDFVIGTDKFNFRRLDTNPGLPGTQGFTFVGNAAFAGGGTASIRYGNSGADLRVEADVNGDGVADMHIILTGLGGGTMTAADFLL